MNFFDNANVQGIGTTKTRPTTSPACQLQQGKKIHKYYAPQPLFFKSMVGMSLGLVK